MNMYDHTEPYYQNDDPSPVDPERLAMASKLEDEICWDCSGPRYICTNTVTHAGNGIGPIIWQGREFAVTTRGIEHRAGIFSTVPYSAVWDDDLMQEMAHKPVDLEDFSEALKLATRVAGAIEDATARK